METVKTYHTFSREGERRSFAISRMEDIYDKRNGEVDEPHRHNYYTVLLVLEARGSHNIDFNRYDLADRQIYFVSPGQVHQVIEEKRSIGFVMTFSTDFLVRNAIPLSFISDLNLFQNYGHTPPLIPDVTDFTKIIDFTQEIFELYQSESNHKFQSIGAYLKLLLISCSNLCNLENQVLDEMDGKSQLFRDFKHAVDTHYKEEHSAKFYANLFHITPDHLNRLVKAKIGKTTKEYIQSRITTEAKRLLFFTDLSNKEIGYKLGFDAPSNFSAFFKKCTKMSPSDFKLQELKKV